MKGKLLEFVACDLTEVPDVIAEWQSRGWRVTAEGRDASGQARLTLEKPKRARRKPAKNAWEPSAGSIDRRGPKEGL